ncbi:photosystem II repair protein Psb32 [Trichothermofontia sp.]
MQSLRKLFQYGWRLVLRLGLLLGLMLVTLLGTIAPAQATGVYDIPRPASDGTPWIIDQADIISRSNENKLNSAFQSLADTQGVQVHFVTIYRFDYGETAASLTDSLFQTWFPTPEAQSHQVLLLLDNLTNDVAIRTGDAVKAVLPDAIATSVANENILIPLREGNQYNRAFTEAADRLIAVISGEPDPGPPTEQETIQAESTFTKAEETDTQSSTIVVIGLLIAATVIPMVTYYLYQAR